MGEYLADSVTMLMLGLVTGANLGWIYCVYKFPEPRAELYKHKWGPLYVSILALLCGCVMGWLISRVIVSLVSILGSAG